MDAASDAMDAQMDAATDAAVDAGADAKVDAAVDAVVDATTDAATDAASDATTDATVDAAMDAAVDAAADASTVDAGLCPPILTPVAAPGDPIDGDTWDTFARDFFASYCTRCHASTLTTPVERMNAPMGLNWDDPDLVRTYLGNIRYDVGVDDYMPVDAPLPSCAERLRLVRWIDAAP